MFIIKHIPNALTILRCLLCPLTLLAFYHYQYIAGLIIYALACSTDYLDGYLARKFNVTSPLGSLLDPICDKLTTLAFFALLLIMEACPSWFLGLFISVSLLQTIGFLIVKFPARLSRLVIEPLKIGKLNTLVQFVWIGVLFADIVLRSHFPRNFHFSPTFYNLGYAVLGLMQIFVFVRYFFQFRHQLIPDLKQSSSVVH